MLCGQSDGRTYGHVITKISRMDGLPNFLNVWGSAIRFSLGPFCLRSVQAYISYSYLDFAGHSERFLNAPNVFFNKQSICHEEDKRGNRLLSPCSGMFVSNSKEDITIELSALEPGWKIKGSSIKVRKENYEVTLGYNKMHRQKQTYESFTFQHLMGFLERFNT